MHILVTGSDGFTGRYACAELRRHGHTVTVLQSDLTDAAAVAAEVARAAPRAVLHLAAIAFVGHADPAAFYQVNLVGTLNLLRALADGAPQLDVAMLISSAAVYGNQSDGPLAEGAALAPASDYAVSKAAMEQMAALWRERLPLTVVRPFNYTGVGQDEQFVVPKIAAHFRARQPAIALGNLDVSREFGDVRDVVAIYRQLLEQPLPGATLNVCTGTAVALRDVLGRCERITGHQLDVGVNPQLVRARDVDVLRGDGAVLSAHLGPAPRRALDDTLRWMLDPAALPPPVPE